MDLTSVLVLAMRELIFFLVADTVLCFGFSMGIMLTTHWCIGCYVMDPTLSYGHFSFPRLCQWAGAQKAGRKHVQDSWPDLAKGIVRSTEHHAQTINWGGSQEERLIMAWEWVWHQSAGSEQLYCITCFSWVFFLHVSVSPFFSSSLLLFTIAISISITPDFPLHPTEGAGSTWAAAVW